MMLPGMAPELPAIDDPSGDDWYTPQFILDWMPPIVLDPCYSAASLVQAGMTLDIRRGEDGLGDAWPMTGGEGVVFMNPPFSNTAAWLRKASMEAVRLNRCVVCLVPALPGDGPWHNEIWSAAPYVGFINGRVSFRDPRGKVESKGRGHALVLFGSETAARNAALQIIGKADRHAQAPVWVRRWVP